MLRRQGRGYKYIRAEIVVVNTLSHNGGRCEQFRVRWDPQPRARHPHFHKTYYQRFPLTTGPVDAHPCRSILPCLLLHRQAHTTELSSRSLIHTCKHTHVGLCVQVWVCVQCIGTNMVHGRSCTVHPTQFVPHKMQLHEQTNSWSSFILCSRVAISRWCSAIFSAQCACSRDTVSRAT
jgi:hypothetical protein